jgi:hypothetical protein
MRRILLFAGIALLAPAAWTDTLILRDGGQHNGRFISGSGDSITFRDDNGNSRSYRVADVQSLQFDSSRSDRLNVRPDASAANSPARTVPAGTEILVRTGEKIDSGSGSSEGRVYPASVERDVTDSAGNVVVPRGSAAELVVREVNQGGTTGSPELVLDLQSLRAGNQRYLVSTEDVSQSNREGLGKNKRTAEMVGGGAVLGTILGAIAGGGKGAAIGAMAGGAAGAGAQVLTRGKDVKVPAETQLTFRLDQPVNLVPERR